MKTIAQTFMGVLFALVIFQVLTSFFTVYQQRQAERMEYEAQMEKLDNLNRSLKEATEKLRQNNLD